MPQALETIRWNPPVIAEVPVAPEVVAEAKRRMKKVPPSVKLVAASPWLGRLVVIHESQKAFSHLTAREVEIAAFVAAQESSCRFCYGLQRAMLKLVGFREDKIRAIERDAELGDPRTTALIAFCRKLAQSNPRPAKAEREALERAGFGRGAIAELVFSVACECLVTRITSFLAAPPVEALERLSARWWSVLLRPMFVVMARPRRAPPVQGAAEGPFAALLAPLGGTALQRVAREMLEHLLAPSAIGTRTKLLMVATVARAMGCRLCERMATDLIHADELDPAQIAEILDTLESPRLAAGEAKLVAFARLTLRYEPYQMQERTARLRDDLGAEMAVEAVGVAGLANMMVRLATLRT